MTGEASPAIRPMTEAHLDACGSIVDALTLFQAYGYSGASARRELSTALADPRADLRVAVADGRTIGFAWFVRRGAFDRGGYLRLLAADPKSQARGVGRGLMAALEEAHLPEADILLLVTADNTAARGFYERIGYVPLAELPGYVRGDKTECLYWKPRRG